MQQEFLYVYQVFKEGSFSKAAQKLYITQPALSIAIQKIEHAIGLPLFDRSSHPLALTPAGEIYINTIEKARNLDREMEEQLQDIRELNRGHIRLGGSHYLNAYILPSLLAKFNQLYPGIELDIEEHSAATLASMLSSHEVDLTFSCNEAFLMDFERYPAFTDHMLLAVQEDHPINTQLVSYALTSADIKEGRHRNDACPAVTLSPFKEMDFILLSSGNNLHDRALRMFADAGYEPKIKLQLSQLVTAYHMAEHFPVATFVSDRLVMHSHAHLKYYKLDSAHAERLFYILLPKQNYTSLAVKRFIEFFILES